MSKKVDVLLIGGAGYIGSHICKHLLDTGFSIAIFDILINHNQDSKIWAEYLEGNILEAQALEKAFEKYRPSIVIHLASFINISESIIDPQKYYTNNLLGSINILNAIKKWGVKHLIFSSSCALYGSDLVKKNQESDLAHPKSPYATIKLQIENMIEDYSKAYHFNFLNLRYYNVSGLDPLVDFKRSPNTRLSLIPLALKSIPSPLHIFGHDFATYDKTAVCDYIHVKDVAIAHNLACLYLMNNKASQTLNIGSGQGHSVLEVIKTIQTVTGNKIEYVLDQKKPGNSGFSVADMTKTSEILGFSAKHSTLREIILSEIP